MLTMEKKRKRKTSEEICRLATTDGNSQKKKEVINTTSSVKVKTIFVVVFCQILFLSQHLLYRLGDKG